MSILLVALSLNAIANADNQITFTKVDGNIYVETSSNQYALYERPRHEQGGSNIVVVNKGEHYLVSPNCESKWSDLSKIESSRLQQYKDMREYYLIGASKTASTSKIYTWKGTFSNESEPRYYAKKLGKKTIALSSKHFPRGLSKVIISGKVIIFIQEDGTITMKTYKCLAKNEKILVKGIKNILKYDDRGSWSIPKKDQPLKVHLQHNPIDKIDFFKELMYMRTYSGKESAAINQIFETDSLRHV